MVKVKPTADGQAGDTTAARAYVEQNFPGAVLKEENYGEIYYQISSETIPVAELFARLEYMRTSLNLIDQSISQTTLEQVSDMIAYNLHTITCQVFLSFAKNQNEDAHAVSFA